jgi:tetratricopeptide (TPR) repeat protein
VDFCCSYNRVALPYSWVRFLYCVVGIVVLAGLTSVIAAAQSLSSTVTVMVMPFDNHSKAVGLDWISEACPAVLSQRMSSPKVYVVSRDDRIFAFDRGGVPAAVHPSRATVFNVAEQMDADYVVLGSYEVNGDSFQVSAQLLDVKKLRLHPLVQSTGRLADFVSLQTSLAWQLLRLMPYPPQVTQQQFIQASSPIRLDAFENYIRGVMATNPPQKIRYFREAIRLNPGYTSAALQLGRLYYGNHEYEQAAAWLSKIPKDDATGGEATFLLGMSEYYRGYLDRAYTAFNYLVTRLPLTEVYNNLGVVDARRGRRTVAVEYFSKAVAADPGEPDYRFNLAVALFKNGDTAGAARQLREELQRRPTDAEAKSLLEMINRGVTAPPVVTSAAAGSASPGSGSQLRIPIERIKRNYDEASYRQLEMEISNLNDKRRASGSNPASLPGKPVPK